MQEIIAKLTDQAGNRHQQYRSADRLIALHLRYGEIGIPAVAAAARYLSDARSAECPPAVTELEHRRAAIA